MLGGGAHFYVVGKVQAGGVVDDLAVDVLSVLGAEWRPAYEALEHDGAEGPLSRVQQRQPPRFTREEPCTHPVTVERIPLPGEDLRRDVIWRADRGVGHEAPRLSPLVDLRAVADRQADLVDVDQVAVGVLRVARGCVAAAVEQFVVVVVVVQPPEAGGKAEVCELDVASPVEEYVVRFYVSDEMSD